MLSTLYLRDKLFVSLWYVKLKFCHRSRTFCVIMYNRRSHHPENCDFDLIPEKMQRIGLLCYQQTIHRCNSKISPVSCLRLSQIRGLQLLSDIRSEPWQNRAELRCNSILQRRFSSPIADLDDDSHLWPKTATNMIYNTCPQGFCMIIERSGKLRWRYLKILIFDE